MATVTVVGNANIETTIRVEGFPLAYQPTRFAPFGMASTVSAVGYNLTKALSTLGHTVRLASIIGPDLPGQLIQAQMQDLQLDLAYLVPIAGATPQSTVLYDATGARMVITDLKDVLTCVYPPDLFQRAITGSDLVVLTNIAYCKPLLPIVQQAGTIIATDIHAVTHLDDPYHLPFLQHATILFLSGELLDVAHEMCADYLFAHYQTQIIVIGLGARGGYLAVRDPVIRTYLPAVVTRPVVQTGGAGDALFAAFLHGFLQG